MHQPIPQQGRWLQQVVTGYFNYHARGADKQFDTDRVPIPRHQSLAAHATAAETERLEDLGADQAVGRRLVPEMRILHPWPASRFAVRPPRWEKLWGGRRRSWHLHRPHQRIEVAPCPKSMISAEA